MRRNRRAGVEDRWYRKVRQRDGTTKRVPSANFEKGLRWRARYVDDAGREHTKGFRHKVHAKQWLDKQVSDQITGTWTDPALSNVTFAAIAERWITTKANRSPKTVAGYRSLLDTVVLPRWQDVPLREIRFDDIQVWVTGLSAHGSMRFEGKGLSASRVRQAHQVIGAVLKFAVRAKHLAANPADEIELPRLPETEQRFLTQEQLQRLAIGSGRYRTLILVLGYCGLRFGEAAALRIADLDLDARRIRVARSVTAIPKRGMVEGPTKTHSNRSVSIPKRLAQLLKTEIGNRNGTELLFPPRRGKYLTLGQVRWVFDAAAKGIDQEGLRLQDLRHTCASLAISAGANVKVVQRLLGHKTATLTLDRYGHLMPDDLDIVADALDAGWKSAADALRTAQSETFVVEEDDSA